MSVRIEKWKGRTFEAPESLTSWSWWVDLGISLEGGMDLELQRPSSDRALLYKDIFRTIRYKLEYLVCKNLMKQCYKTWLFYSNKYDDDNDNDGDDRQ